MLIIKKTIWSNMTSSRIEIKTARMCYFDVEK